MRLNTLKPAEGAKTEKTRVGRGIGCGMGKTCGRGHKGQRARAGGFHKVGFEGGQMPLQRRLPKFGFNSKVNVDTLVLRLSDLNALEPGKIDLLVLKAARVVPHHVKKVKIILKGELTGAYEIQGLAVTKGAQAAIEAKGGKVVDSE